MHQGEEGHIVALNTHAATSSDPTGSYDDLLFGQPVGALALEVVVVRV